MHRSGIRARYYEYTKLVGPVILAFTLGSLLGSMFTQSSELFVNYSSSSSVLAYCIECLMKLMGCVGYDNFEAFEYECDAKMDTTVDTSYCSSL